MPTKESAPNVPTVESMQPNDLRWKFWCDARNVPYWRAALLTLNIEPSPRNKKILKTYYKDVDEEAENRIEAMLKRRLTYPALRSVGTKKTDDRPRNEFVSLPGVAKFATEVNWSGSGQLARRVFPKVTADVDQEADELSVGTRNTYVRYAALVELLRLAIDKPNELGALRESAANRVKAKQEQPRNSISNEGLGALVAEMVRTFAGAKNSPPYGFGKAKNADEMAKADRIRRGHAW
jgi:hypothetical protein